MITTKALGQMRAKQCTSPKIEVKGLGRKGEIFPKFVEKTKFHLSGAILNCLNSCSHD